MKDEQSAGITATDLAWERINALGGSPQQNNSYDQGFVDAITQALNVIEALGGSDPAPKRHRATEAA
jgi:hypothetical protein